MTPGNRLTTSKGLCSGKNRDMAGARERHMVGLSYFFAAVWSSKQESGGIEMTSGLPSELAYIAAVIVVPAAAISLLALACAKGHKTRRFAYSVLLLACTAAVAVPVAMRWWSPYSGDPLTWRDAPGAFLILAMPVGFLLGALIE
jgi:hypothetical protein